MKVVILAGGTGSRLSEESDLIPKPLINIGDRPILWHIMKIYSSFGFNDFIVLLGYKGYIIKEYFSNYYLHQSDVTIDLETNQTSILNNSSEPWKITLLDTGIHSLTGSRLKNAQRFIGDAAFMLTYGDGVADINIKELLKFHSAHGRILTMTSVKPEGRFGALNINERNQVERFTEKPQGDGTWVNGGFFVCEPGIFDYIDEKQNVVFEQAPLENLAKDGELFTYKHSGFWMPMDTLRDKRLLSELWATGNAKWKIW